MEFQLENFVVTGLVATVAIILICLVIVSYLLCRGLEVNADMAEHLSELNERMEIEEMSEVVLNYIADNHDSDNPDIQSRLNTIYQLVRKNKIEDAFILLES
jgi:replicative DNA helicase